MPKRSALRLTKRIVERLKADDKDAIFWDRDLAGFGVRVHATGRKLYIVQSRGPAGLKRVTLGPVGSETIEKRRREAAIRARCSRSSSSTTVPARRSASPPRRRSPCGRCARSGAGSGLRGPGTPERVRRCTTSSCFSTAT